MGGRPRARTEDVITERVDDELVVYDARTQVAHCLSRDAAVVWERCDGNLSTSEIAGRLDISQEAVERAVEAISECGLLDVPPVIGEHKRTYSRREATFRLAKAGGAAFAAPLIYSAVVGSVAAAQSPGSLPRAGDFSGCAPGQVPTGGTAIPGTSVGIGVNSSTGCNAACPNPKNCGLWTAPTCAYGLCYQSSIPTGNSCSTCDLALTTNVCCYCGQTGSLFCSPTIQYRCATQYNCRLDGAACPGRTDVCGPSPSPEAPNCLPPTDGTVTRLCCTADGTATGAPVACSQTTGANFGCCGGFCNNGVCAPCPSTAACLTR